MKYLKTLNFLTCCLVVNVLATLSTAQAAEPPNVLFLSIDDLRNELGCLGVEHAQTPNLDALASKSRLFSRHYTQVPTCGASRAALLSGLYPRRPAHLGNNAIRETHPEWVAQSLPANFRNQGYQTLALGKISHYPGGLTGKAWAEGPEELPGVWDRCWVPEAPWTTPEAMMHGFANGQARKPGQSPPLEAFDGPDKAYPDAWVAEEAINTLKDLAGSERPWFFAVGFFKPHLPFAAPKRYFDHHDPEKIASPAVTERPKEPSSWHRSGEFRNNYGHESGRDPETDLDYARELRHAYAAAITYVDAQVGRVLDTLQDLGLAENTVIVLWSDHGFLMGEHAIWGKHCLYENALRSPLMIRYPGLPRPGEGSEAISETVDLLPTLLDLCGLPPQSGIDGRSLRPHLEDPEADSERPALAFWSNQRTIRTDRWRLIAHPGQEPSSPAVELFDMANDPNESSNVAADHPETVRELLQILAEAPRPR